MTDSAGLAISVSQLSQQNVYNDFLDSRVCDALLTTGHLLLSHLLAMLIALHILMLPADAWPGRHHTGARFTHRCCKAVVPAIDMPLTTHHSVQCPVTPNPRADTQPSLHAQLQHHSCSTHGPARYHWQSTPFLLHTHATQT